MISIITCHYNDKNYEEFQDSIKKTIGTDYEIIKIDNKNSKTFLTRAYNDGIDMANGDILVFAHEDILFLNEGWGSVLEEKLKNQNIGVLGVAGSKLLLQNAQWWFTGMDYCVGAVVHCQNERREKTIFNESEGDHEVVVADGLFMACNKQTIKAYDLKFDETFDNYHFYDISFCFEAFLKGLKNIVTYSIEIEHKSVGVTGPEWNHYRGVFIRKYADKLPASVNGVVFDQNAFVRKDFKLGNI